jgi:hypothetical protein
MAFGQQSGPPASAGQIRELLALLQDAGHTDFRDARGPMGFTQRQSAGKFTREEAAELIDRLQDLQDGAGGASGARPAARPVGGQRNLARVPGGASGARPAARPVGGQQDLARVPTEHLAAELRRRGWSVSGPELSPTPQSPDRPAVDPA